MRPQEHIPAKRMQGAVGVTETALQMALVEHIERRAAPDLVWFHIPNGEARARVTGAILKRMGVKRGVPDLQFIHRGRVRFLELKRDKGRLSPEQEHMHHALRVASEGLIEIETAFGLNEALQILTKWRVLR